MTVVLPPVLDDMAGELIDPDVARIGATRPIAEPLLSQSAAMGALPQLYAAVAPGVEGDDYVGPDGLGEIAAREGLVLHELVDVAPSLEEAFMELTRDAVEYHGSTETNERTAA